LTVTDIALDAFGFVPFVAASKSGTKSPVYLPFDKSVEVYEANRSNTHTPSQPTIEQISLSFMEDEDYLGFLNSQNFNYSAFLGKLAPQGLCALDFDDEEFFNNFLNINPFIKDTLIIKANRRQAWIRIEGPVPSPVYLSANNNHVGEFRSTGWCSVFHGTHPHGIKYEKDNNKKPISIEFEEIKWPKGLSFSRFLFSGEYMPINKINDRKSFHHKIIISKGDLDCPPEDYSHIAVSYMNSNIKEIMRYDISASELINSWDQHQDVVEFDRYFELPEPPKELWIEPYSKTKLFRSRVIFKLDLKPTHFTTQEALNANWLFA